MRVGQLPCSLLHPGFVRRAGDSCDLHRARLEPHHEEDGVPDQSAYGQDLDSEEVGRRQAVPMSGEERLPGRLRAVLGCGLDAVVLEDSLDRVAGDFVAEALQRAADSRVAPGRVLVRHAGHEHGNVRLGAGATGDALLRAGVFLGDEPAVPTKNRVRGDDAHDVPEATPTQRLSLHRQAAPLVVSEPEPAATALRAQHAVLLEQVVDDRCCWRLTQPESRRRKKASGGDNASMGPQLPQGAPTLQAWSGMRDRDPVAGWTSRARP